ncbi:MAG TPA: response regulator [Cyanobacteria bacterium UBA11149]|nr:response regulator [Cyanobacteria bacterium UBA11367]HBE60727.1 response regulator [Cyanobacteria bacterium UBA11366]HBK65458.1 response regulator [Cyanobacteria bacterium UBA11166]HBR74476.1 response regulator [Cyanobacteria bacterium UBA11159]HBS68274.1 response regulator [Cyanobacteria bacterium UBA11153]HBW91385.1 response regulator [Cyanobacteria bacterium UBA11149]HCA93580.1 response regulator [Cyanobacteria bacterium UBA9226]
MKTSQILTTDDLIQQIISRAREQFTGWLDLGFAEDKNLRLYFYGGLIYSGSGIHPLRSWYRLLSRNSPELIEDPIAQKLPKQDGNYRLLTQLLKQEKISQEQMGEIIESTILEIIFDIFQLLAQPNSYPELGFNYSWISQTNIDSPLVAFHPEEMWRQGMQLWETWQRGGLAEISPNLAPKVLQESELQRQTSELIYRNLLSLADGNLTFRDLAAKSNRNLLIMTQPMLPYIRQELIGLIPVDDLNISINLPVYINKTKEKKIEVGNLDNSDYQPSSISPLVACIDDSRIDNIAISHIIANAGCQCITIQDGYEAISTLLSHKPDLIFLDLIMPITNGFEICAQIRRIPVFKDTPVIIVTGKNGAIDRTRAKIVGASGFITKPIKQEEVLKILKHHLPLLKI